MMNWKNGLVFGLVAGATLVAAACSSDSGSSNNNAGTGGQGGTGGISGTGGNSSGGNGGTKTFDAGSDPNRNAVTAGGLCQRLAEIQCAGEAYCCDNPGRTVDACVTAQKTACSDSLLNFDSVAADPVTGFDATKAKTAFTTFETKASTCATDIAAFAASATGIRGIAAGTVATGGTCNPTSTSDPVKIAAALASCTDPASQACMPASTGDWKCTALADAGGACYTDINCKEGLYCDNPNLDLTGATCKARKADGQTCALPNECTGLACVADKCASGQQAAYCLAP